MDFKISRLAVSAIAVIEDGRASGMSGDFGAESRHIVSMSSEPLTLPEKQAAEYHARWEAMETVKAQELAAPLDERALKIIPSLSAVAGWRARPDWSGPVEPQAIFQRGQAR